MLCVCFYHEMHMQFCCMRVILCVFSSEPRAHEKTLKLLVHVYTFLYTRARVY